MDKVVNTGIAQPVKWSNSITSMHTRRAEGTPVPYARFNSTVVHMNSIYIRDRCRCSTHISMRHTLRLVASTTIPVQRYKYLVLLPRVLVFLYRHSMYCNDLVFRVQDDADLKLASVTVRLIITFQTHLLTSHNPIESGTTVQVHCPTPICN